ncbi:MAG: hypothetical protein OEW97_00290 [Gammaproteobacteria bacterium]|nr:hypothetical protein [Gammaproteobacteria bacterium]
MLKWVAGSIVLLIILVIIIQPEWLNVLSAVFSDYIRANEK